MMDFVFFIGGFILGCISTVLICDFINRLDKIEIKSDGLKDE